MERKKLKPGEKSLWDQMGRNTDNEPVVQEAVKEVEEQKPERFKMIKGIVRGGGLASVFKKKV